MNLVLLTPEEAADSPVLLRDHRATHIREVLRARVGDRVRVGILDGATGTGEVTALDTAAVALDCRFDEPAAHRSADTLLLAVPRPVVLQRCLAQAAALGFGHIVLFRSWRVDKGHLRATALQEDRIRARLVEGLAQARRTHRPRMHFFPLFKPFVEDFLDGLLDEAGCHGRRFVAHPEAATDLADRRVEPGTPFALALGPERGFIPYEINALEARGFTPVRAGPHPLRVETALAYITGQLRLLSCRRRGFDSR